MTKLPCHPNVLNDYNICLDLLEASRSEVATGWTSAYTASSILIQLQNFLFVFNEKAHKHLINYALIEKSKIEANE